MAISYANNTSNKIDIYIDIVIKRAPMFMGYSNEQLLEIGRKTAERQEKQKAYDKWYLAKAKHELNELKRIVKENGLEIQAFEKTIEDYKD